MKILMLILLVLLSLSWAQAQEEFHPSTMPEMPRQEEQDYEAEEEDLLSAEEPMEEMAPAYSDSVDFSQEDEYD